MAATQDELPTGNVAKLVNRLSKDLSKDIVFRKPGAVNSTKIATVRYSYEAAQEDELTLMVNDVIEVIEEAEAGWMKGRLRNTGQIGLFPTNFVQFSEGQPVNKNGSFKAETKKKISDSVTDESPEANQRSSGTDASKGRITAPFAAGGVKKPSHESEPDGSSTKAPFAAGGVKKPSHESEPDGSSTKEMAKVLYLYTPNHDDELALKEIGALVTVISKTCSDPGWILGEIDGKRGLIPDNFVEFVKVPVSASETKKVSPVTISSVPSVPAKPVKPSGLITSGIGSGAGKPPSVGTSISGKSPSSGTSAASGSRGGSRILNTEFATTLAEALNKQPKTFGLKPAVKYEEGSAENRVEGPLEHITTSRPKQPNKRPPSTVFNKRKSNDILMDTAISETGEPEPSTLPSRTTTSSSATVTTFSTQAAFSAPKTVPQPTVFKSERGDSEYITYAEFQRFLEKFEKFSTEMFARIAQLEAKIASSK